MTAARTPYREVPRTGFDYLDNIADRPGGIIAMAHRGGAGHPGLVGLENTLAAFRHAVTLGYHYLETDVHTTRDGVLVAFHDDVLDRVTDRTGAIADLTASEVLAARIAGTHAIPTMAELLGTLPESRFNIDLKSHTAAAPLARLLAETGSEDRVCVGAFSLARIREFRHLTHGRVATAAAPTEVAAFLAAPTGSVARRLTRGRVAALQVPHRRGRIPVVTASLVRRAHRAGAQVHVWTVDDPVEMAELLDLGVDGLITDRTDVLAAELGRRGLWRDQG